MSNELIEADPMTAAEREEQIRLSAYYIWKTNGEPEGTAEQDWCRAEAENAENAETEESIESTE